jgi:thiamine-monophosphate kinase
LTQLAAGNRPVRDVGEFGLIDGITNLLATSQARASDIQLGLGDDGAVWRPRPNRSLVVSTDMLVEGIHFRRDWSSAESIGYRSLAVNLSDIAAMGARPRVAVVGLGLRDDTTDRWVYDFYKGAMLVSEPYGVRIVGGDIVRSPNHVTVSVTAHGELPRNRPPLRRDAARPGDVLAVTGPLGLAAAGIRLLIEGGLRREGAPTMLDAHRRPEPRVLQGLLLSRAGVRCAMDISDGLLGDLPKICGASGVAATIEYDRLPVPNAVRWDFPDWLDLALRGGEDFELLFACSPMMLERVTRLFRAHGCRPPIRIGSLVEFKETKPIIQLLRADRRYEPLEIGAYSHFG